MLLNESRTVINVFCVFFTSPSMSLWTGIDGHGIPRRWSHVSRKGYRLTCSEVTFWETTSWIHFAPQKDQEMIIKCSFKVLSPFNSNEERYLPQPSTSTLIYPLPFDKLQLLKYANIFISVRVMYILRKL